MESLSAWFATVPVGDDSDTLNPLIPTLKITVLYLVIYGFFIAFQSFSKIYLFRSQKTVKDKRKSFKQVRASRC